MEKYECSKISIGAAIEDLEILKFVPDNLRTKQMCKLYFNEDSGNVVFSCNEIGILNIDLNNIKLDDSNYEQDDPATIILIIRNPPLKM